MRKWTKMQKLAIDTRDKTLLVSAGAGSGKTATLTERIIESVLDKEKPESIGNMLIATFTNAAVGELRERITAAVKDALQKDPGNEYLSHELAILPSAKITTIDAFCSEILRANCDRVGVPQGYRIADEAEAELLKNNLLDGIINEIYEGRLPEVGTTEEIENLSSCLTDSNRQEDFSEQMTYIYAKTEDIPEGVDMVDTLAETYNPEKYTCVENTVYGKYIMDFAKEAAEHWINATRVYLCEIEEKHEARQKKRIEVLNQDLEMWRKIRDSQTYSELFEFVKTIVYPRTPPLKNDNTPIAKLRGLAKDDLTILKDKFLKYDEEFWRISFEKTYPVLKFLAKLLKFFYQKFKEEKIRRGICEYSDVVRYCYECLYEDGELTDVAYAQKELYSSIYVDEYQDVNSIQHKIFDAISTETNRFMVGDIKQSIYAFRGANPEEFADMKKRFPNMKEKCDCADSNFASIFMSENFRCDKGVVDFVNAIFDRIFFGLRDSIGYVEGDKLLFSKIYDGETPEYLKPTLAVFEAPSQKKKTAQDSDDSDEEDENPTSVSSLSMQARCVAAKIHELLDHGYLDNGEKITEDDIAIIMRSPKKKYKRYALALESEGINSVVAVRDSFFTGPEVLLALAMLNAVDNPHKDIYLASFMCSPLCGFTADELAVIRKQGRGYTLYDSLKNYTKANKGYTRGENFLKNLQKYRIMSEGMTVDMLIGRLFRETGILSLASKNGGKENLMRLYEYARKFENSSYKGLYNFLNYINNITDRKNSFDKVEAPEASGAVRIISVHGSKGLEFPIVFYVEAQSSYKSAGGMMGKGSRVKYDDRIGIGIKTRTDDGLSLVESPTAEIIQSFSQRRDTEEEARILYVGLTRAREQLYVTAELANKPYSELQSTIEVLKNTFTTHGVYSYKSHFDMILGATGIEPLHYLDFLEKPINFEQSLSGEEEKTEQVEETEETEEHTDFFKTLLERFNFKYKNQHLTELPEKLSVSKLYPEILNISDDETTVLDFDNNSTGIEDVKDGTRQEFNGKNANAFGKKNSHELQFQKSGILPKFYTGKDADDSAKRGIATHLLFQFCDLERLKEKGAEEELRCLKEDKFISERDSERVRLSEVELFRSSKLIDDMLNADNIWRELRFNVRMPAKDFTTDEKLKELYEDTEILVQGVIDCLYEDKNGDLHLIDYKTDRLSKAELSNRALAERKLYLAHSLQLSYYSYAIEKMFGKKPKTVEVYSLPLGDTVDVKRK